MNIFALLNPIAALTKISDEVVRTDEMTEESTDLADVEQALTELPDIPPRQANPIDHTASTESILGTYRRTNYAHADTTSLSRDGGTRSSTQSSPALVPAIETSKNNLYRLDRSLAGTQSSGSTHIEPPHLSTRFFDFFLRGPTAPDSPYVVRHANEFIDDQGDIWARLPRAAHILNQKNVSFQVHNLVRVCFAIPPSGHAKIIELRQGQEECIAVVQWLYTKSDAKYVGMTRSRARRWPSGIKALSNHYQIITEGNIDRLETCKICKDKIFDARRSKTLQRMLSIV